MELNHAGAAGPLFRHSNSTTKLIPRPKSTVARPLRCFGRCSSTKNRVNGSLRRARQGGIAASLMDDPVICRLQQGPNTWSGVDPTRHDLGINGDPTQESGGTPSAEGKILALTFPDLASCGVAGPELDLGRVPRFLTLSRTPVVVLFRPSSVDQVRLNQPKAVGWSH